MNDLGFEPISDIVARLVEKFSVRHSTELTGESRPLGPTSSNAGTWPVLAEPLVDAFNPSCALGPASEPGPVRGFRLMRIVAAGQPETGRRPLSAGARTADVIVAVFGEFGKIRAFAPRSLEGIADSPAAFRQGGDDRQPTGRGPAPLASVATLEAMP